MQKYSVSGNITDIVNERIFSGTVHIENGKIASLVEEAGKTYSNYILPGFVDSHVHIESSMLIPSEFARMAVAHGTVATVSDPHEIANVLGIEGVRYMIDNGTKVPFKFCFAAPSCVPATPFETAGAEISASDIEELFEKDGLTYLSELMNYPGVIYKFPKVIEKLEIAKKYNKRIDGHAPGLIGPDIEIYAGAGISTDHECVDYNEALEKIRLGMKILIREGSAAKNFDALHLLLKTHPDHCMFCSDDKHPDDLLVGHINQAVKRALALGYPLMDVLRVAIKNPIDHYNLDVGMLRPGDSADFIEVNNLKDFDILKTYINGKLVAENGISKIKSVAAKTPNNFKAEKKTVEDFHLVPQADLVRVIKVSDGQLLTKAVISLAKVENGNTVSDTENDILKAAVVNRYRNTPPALGFIQNFKLKSGAIASSVGHDSHNIIAVGTGDEEICAAVNAVIEAKGGMAVANKGEVDSLPLPVAGLMTTADGYETAHKYSELSEAAKALGSDLNAPFMTLSFMALLVIPQIKLSDKGLFNGDKFEFVDVFVK
ncbi:MAG: adenine deaminase [Candidatus Kapabacteria bacterium]|jgi:adenine deaminase|nr:adenine deaminase [Candidatus Kapabacteria bacterium]